MGVTSGVGGKGLSLNTCPNCGETRDVPLHCDDCDKEICEHCYKGNEPFRFCSDCSFDGDE